MKVEPSGVRLMSVTEMKVTDGYLTNLMADCRLSEKAYLRSALFLMNFRQLESWRLTIRVFLFLFFSLPLVRFLKRSSLASLYSSILW